MTDATVRNTFSMKSFCFRGQCFHFFGNRRDSARGWNEGGAFLSQIVRSTPSSPPRITGLCNSSFPPACIFAVSTAQQEGVCGPIFCYRLPECRLPGAIGRASCDDLHQTSFGRGYRGSSFFFSPSRPRTLGRGC